MANNEGNASPVGFDIFGIGQILRSLAQIVALETEIRDLLKNIRTLLTPPVPKPASRLRFNVKFPNKPLEVNVMAFQLQDVQTVTLTLVPQDADGNATTLPAGVVPAWSSSDPTGVAVTPAVDGLTAVAAGGAHLGDVQVNVSAAINPALTLTGQLVITVVAGPAATIAITPGIPTP